MRTVVVPFPEALPTVKDDGTTLPTSGGGIELAVDDGLDVRVLDGLAGPLVDVATAGGGRVQIFTHRETAWMDARDYGSEVSRLLPALVGPVEQVRGRYTVLAGIQSALVTGVADADAVEARCVAPNAVRVIVLSRHRIDDAAGAAAVAAVVDGIRFV